MHLGKIKKPVLPSSVEVIGDIKRNTFHYIRIANMLIVQLINLFVNLPNVKLSSLSFKPYQIIFN